MNDYYEYCHEQLNEMYQAQLFQSKVNCAKLSQAAKTELTDRQKEALIRNEQIRQKYAGHK